MWRGLGRGEAWEAVSDVLPCLGVGDTRALAVVQLECFSAFCLGTRILPVSLRDMEAVAVGLGVEAPSRPGKPGAYQLCIKTLRSSRSAASLS